jgi:nitroreductase
MPAEFPYRTRRTVKPNMLDSSREIDHSLLLEILEDANWAPTHGITQPWRFHVFVGEARSTLGDALISIYDRITPSNEVRPEKRAKLRSNCEQAPVIIAVAARVEPAGKISTLDELCATACAVQNLLLSSHQRGLGSFWSSAAAGCSQEFLTWLGLDSTHHALGLVYLGYPKEGAIPDSTRLPLTERVIFHGASAGRAGQDASAPV